MVLLMLFILFTKSFMWTLVVAEENVAYGKLSNQSSYTGSNSAFLAVDGDNTTCFKSSNPGYQWMYVDLLWKYNVQQVTLYGVLTSDYLQVLLTNVEDIRNEAYLTINCSMESTGSSPGGKISKFTCLNGAWKATRYLFIVQSNVSFNQLVICEINAIGSWAEIYQRRNNVLYKKPANDYYNDTSINNPNKSVDGIRDTDQGHEFCYASQEYLFQQNWLKIDMLEKYIIDYVAATSRNSAYAAPRMSNFMIGFSENDFTSLVRGQYPLCARYPGNVKAGTRVTLRCNANLPAYRFFIAQQAYGAFDGYFGMCEVEAYTPLNKNFKFWKLMANNQRLSFAPIVQLAHLTASQCSAYCGYYNGDSFNYNRLEMFCQINKHINGYALSDLQSSPNWTFWTSVYVGT